VRGAAVTEDTFFSKHWRQHQRLLMFWQHSVHFFRKMVFYGRTMVCTGLMWLKIVTRGEGSCQQGNKPLGSIKCWEILKLLCDWRLLKKALRSMVHANKTGNCVNVLYEYFHSGNNYDAQTLIKKNIVFEIGSLNV
jgi:hypothetical protein